MNYEKWREILKGESLPVAVVDLDAFDRNVKKLGEIVSSLGRGKTLRLATKSVRVPELIERALAAGQPYQGLMCYSAVEALHWATRGLDDFLVAYPTLQKSDLQALSEIQKMGKKVSLVIDSVEEAGILNAHFTAAAPLSVLAEVDMSLKLFGAHLGVRRSPVRNEGDLLALVSGIEKLPGIRFSGIMAYEAQIAGLGDRNPFKRFLNPVFTIVRKLSKNSVELLRKNLRQALEARGKKIEIFNGGGTGSINFASREDALTEVTAGSALLSSHLFDYYSNVRFEPSCFFALQAVRSSDAGFVTCQGGGYIASGEPGWDRVPVPYLPKGLKLVSTEGAGEVQTPLKLPRGVEIALGDPILFRHAKAGELAERFNEYVLVSGGKIISRAKTYRGLGWTFY